LTRFSRPPHSFSRRTYFCTLPVEVFGSSQNSTAAGALKWERCSRQKSTISRSVAADPAARVTNAWRQARAPYEQAQARALLAEAHLASGDRDASLVEQRAAHAAFAQLGAEPAAATSASRLKELA
jgi:hypothetical protein